MNKPTYVPNVAGHYNKLLDLFLTSSPDKYSLEMLLFLDILDHSLVNVKVGAKLKASFNIPFHKIITSDYTLSRLLSAFFRNRAAKRASLISSWVLSYMEGFIPQQKYRQRLNSQLFLIPKCDHTTISVRMSGVAEHLLTFRSTGDS